MFERKFGVSSLKIVTLPKHVGVKELKNTLSLKCAFVGANKAFVYQNLIMNFVST
jgi:hypothetical protein